MTVLEQDVRSPKSPSVSKRHGSWCGLVTVWCVACLNPMPDENPSNVGPEYGSTSGAPASDPSSGDPPTTGSGGSSSGVTDAETNGSAGGSGTGASVGAGGAAGAAAPDAGPGDVPDAGAEVSDGGP